MKFANVRIVWLKEIIDGLRDRRTMLLIVLAPLIFDLVYLLVAAYGPQAQLEKQRSQIQEVAIAGGEGSGDLEQFLEEEHLLKTVPVTDPQVALRQNQIAAALILPQDFEEQISQGGSPVQATIEFDESRIDSQIAKEKLKNMLAVYEQTIVDQRIGELDIHPEVINPFTIAEKSVATRGGPAWLQIGFLLSFILIVWASLGGTQTAPDLTVGEKERGTLEALLITPTSHRDLTWGKFLATLTFSMYAMASGLIGMWLLIQLFGAKLLTTNVLKAFTKALEPSIIGVAFVIALFVAAMSNALLVGLSLQARTIREAGIYSTLSLFLIMFAVLFANFRVTEATIPLLFVPIYNAALVLKELFRGELNGPHLIIVLSSSALYILLSLWLAIRAFQSEKILFRQ